MYKPFLEIQKKKKKFKKTQIRSERVKAILNPDFNGVYDFKPGFQHRRRRVEANEA